MDKIDLTDSHDAIRIKRMAEQITKLKEKVNYPEVTVKLEQLGYETYIEATIKLEDHDRITEKHILNAHQGVDTEYLEYITKSLLKSIAMHYIERAYKHRNKDNVKVKEQAIIHAKKGY